MDPKMNIPFSPPDIGEEEINEVVSALKSGWITTGPRTKQFEKLITGQCGSQGSACFDSCTAALESTLRLFGIGPGDEVIVPAYTYTASASVICHVGATPVMIDCASGSFHMDYDRLPGLINERTKAVIPVDIGGVPCDYDRIRQAVSSKAGCFTPRNAMQEALGRVLILADGAHSFGASADHIPTGSLADFTAFSFHAVKNLTTAEGGAITWRQHPGLNSEELYRKYMLLSLHGQSKDALAKTQLGAWEYDIVAPYYKCNMTDIAAAIGIAQMKRFPAMLRRRREIIEYYDQRLEHYPVTVLKHFTDQVCSSGHLYLVRLTRKGETERNELIRHLAAEGVSSNVHYKPLPMMTAYRSLGFRIEDFPNAYEMYHNEITLPLYSRLTDQQICYIADRLTEAL